MQGQTLPALGNSVSMATKCHVCMGLLMPQACNIATVIFNDSVALGAYCMLQIYVVLGVWAMDDPLCGKEPRDQLRWSSNCMEISILKSTQ
jgi:hypothetical protein